jgi:phosphoglucomutase
MTIHEHAGQRVPRDLLPDVPELITRYFLVHPDPSLAAERVAFGTSGHRGSALHRSFNEHHIIAVCAAIVEYRRAHGITGPLFLGKDTHALSDAAFATALEVFAAHEITVVLEAEGRYTATPVISHAILAHNRMRSGTLERADGVVITPSHNPPEDGGFKYNPPTGGPADTAATSAIQKRANELLEGDIGKVPRMPYRHALHALTTHRVDLAGAYIADLPAVLDMDVIAASRVRIGVDPMGGASVDCWDRIAEVHGIELEVSNRDIDPTFAFMPLDWDGRVRMDCSSPHAMAGLLGLQQQYDVAFGLDPDADRHGIVVPRAGLLNPNHYLAVAIDYLLEHRKGWQPHAGIGKTLVSSSLIDRIAAHHMRRLVEVPVGFKWFVDGLLDGKIVFGGEESAGASFLRMDGTVWTTDKDGILLGLLAAEITARTGKDPGEQHRRLEEQFGRSWYARVDAAASPEEKSRLQQLAPEDVAAETLAGERITARHTRATGNGAPIGGLKVEAENGWFAARPSGTEHVYKIYAESFNGPDHLKQIQEEAQQIVQAALGEE